MSKDRERVSREELEALQGEVLPEREAMMLINPVRGTVVEPPEGFVEPQDGVALPFPHGPQDAPDVVPTEPPDEDMT